MPALDNPRHERFAQELAKGKTADEAYVLAGYAENRGNASRMKSDESIGGRVSELLSEASRSVEVTLESIGKQLDEDRALAHRVGQPASAVAASMGKAKLYGLAPEKLIHSGPNDGPIQTEEVSAIDRLESRIAQLAARADQDSSTPRLN
jgi:phage terminase small subunit